MSSSIRRRRNVRRRRWWGDFGATTERSGQPDVVGRSQGTLERHGDHDWFGINLHTGTQSAGTRSLSSRVITLDNIDSLSADAFDDPLIGSLSGNLKRRQATTQIMRDRVRLEQGKYAAVDNFSSLDTGDHLFASVDFNDAPGSDQRDLLRAMLASNHFDYFELDQAIQLDVVNA